MPADSSDEPKLQVLGLGHWHPDNVIDNAFLEGLGIETNDEWIMERVGIRTRRTVLPLDYIQTTGNADPRLSHEVSTHSNAQAGAAAAKMALERAGVRAEQVGLVLSGGCSPQYAIPAEAAQIAAELGIVAPVYDVSSACSSFAAQMHHLNQMRPSAVPEYVLIVQVEITTRTVDYRDRSVCVLWGDGAAAAVVSNQHPGRFTALGTVLHSDPAGWDKVVIPAGGHFRQNGPAVQTFGIRKGGETWKELAPYFASTQPYYIGHQANYRMLCSIAERGGVAEDHHLFNVDEYGNQGAAGAPAVLSQNWDRFAAGEEVGIVVVGSGLTWGGVALRRNS